MIGEGSSHRPRDLLCQGVPEKRVEGPQTAPQGAGDNQGASGQECNGGGPGGGRGVIAVVRVEAH